MNDVMRIYHGAKQRFCPAYSPYRQKLHSSPIANNALKQVLSPVSDSLVLRRVVHSELYHDVNPYLIVDIGEPKLLGKGGARFAAPPLDLDELAACAGQSHMFGKLLGRIIMIAGTYFAVVAVLEAYKALRDDAMTNSELQNALGNARKRSQTPAIRAVADLLESELQERKSSRTANMLLLPGAFGMSVNLLGSAELFGGLMPALQPIAAFAMGPAAIFMALYGGYIAMTSLQSWRASRAASATLQSCQKSIDVQANIWRRVTNLLCTREGNKRLWDAVLALAGVCQAVGALLQWVIGPIWLLVLLPGTVGLVVGKIMRINNVGAQAIDPQADLALLDRDVVTLAKRCLQTEQIWRLLRNIAGGDAKQPELLRQKLAEVCAVGEGALGINDVLRLQQALRMPLPGPAEEVAHYVAALSHLHTFEFLALEVARNVKLPRTPQAREDGEAYIISGSDVVNLVVDAPQEQQEAILQALRVTVTGVLRSYGVALAQEQKVLAAELLARVLKNAAP